MGKKLIQSQQIRRPYHSFRDLTWRRSLSLLLALLNDARFSTPLSAEAPKSEDLLRENAFTMDLRGPCERLER
ncbi:hypothetical protein VNO77_26912 [Canavalia gladiata]|uniref:Uncharacterized protein n=1 Tax=Canavalia gladiata TaxID=3824 RepID=A0AAN9KT73_CANGL